jgi:hypothetical protein
LQHSLQVSLMRVKSSMVIKIFAHIETTTWKRYIKIQTLRLLLF